MSKSKNKWLVIGLLGVTGVAIYFVMKKKAPVSIPVAPGGPVTTLPSSTNPAQSILSSAEQLLLGLLNKTPTTNNAYPPLASTTSALSTPASDIPYINPTTPGIPITGGDGTDLLSEFGLTAV